MRIESFRVGSDNLSYLVYDEVEKVSALVDPGFDASAALSRIEELSLGLLYVIATHDHMDHVAQLQNVKGSKGARSVAFGNISGTSPDIRIGDGSMLDLGRSRLTFYHTPGHTGDSICVKVDESHLLTGDTLFIDDCGRCDLPGGSIGEMFSSLQRIKGMNEDLVLLPGHDYGPMERDTLGGQLRRSHVLLAVDLKEFSGIE